MRVRLAQGCVVRPDICKLYVVPGYSYIGSMAVVLLKVSMQNLA